MTKNELQKTEVRALESLSASLGIKAEVMVNVIKAQCFQSSDPGSITNEQLAAYVSVANSLRSRCPGFDPLIPGFLYAYPKQNGSIQPIVGPDGIYAMLASHPDVDSWETQAIVDDNGDLVACDGKIYRKSSSRPVVKRVWLKEWIMGTNPNWKQRPIHMLETRALKQAARQVIHGMPMDEEEREIANAVEVSFVDEPVQPKEQPLSLPKSKTEAAAQALKVNKAKAKEETEAAAQALKVNKAKAKEEPEPQTEGQERQAEADRPAETPQDDSFQIPINGAEAYNNNYPADVNPFPEGSKFRDQWDADYQKAYADDQV